MERINTEEAYRMSLRLQNELTELNQLIAFESESDYKTASKMSLAAMHLEDCIRILEEL